LVPVLTQLLQSGRLDLVAPLVHGDVLDLGCGHAPLLDRCRPTIRSYTGVDRVRALIDDCALRHPESRFVCLDLEDATLDLGRAFDVVTMIAVMEHVFDQRRLFEAARRCLRPDGVIVLTTPTPWGNDVIHRLGAALGLFSPQAAADHCVIYNRRRLELMASRVGLRMADYRTFQLGCNQRAVLTAVDGAG
jgi:SAM-dependent methyltransferase